MAVQREGLSIDSIEIEFDLVHVLLMVSNSLSFTWFSKNFMISVFRQVRVE